MSVLFDKFLFDLQRFATVTYSGSLSWADNTKLIDFVTTSGGLSTNITLSANADGTSGNSISAIYGATLDGNGKYYATLAGTGFSDDPDKSGDWTNQRIFFGAGVSSFQWSEESSTIDLALKDGANKASFKYEGGTPKEFDFGGAGNAIKVTADNYSALEDKTLTYNKGTGSISGIDYVGITNGTILFTNKDNEGKFVFSGFSGAEGEEYSGDFITFMDVKNLVL